MAATSSTRAAQPATSTANDAIPTVEITAGSSVKSKVRQCLAILQIPNGAPAEPAAQGKGSRKRGNRIVALKAVHPSAGSKTITVAEIAKRSIAAAATAGDKGKGTAGVWWQYTKVESNLIEWPPKKTTAKTQETPVARDEKADEKGDKDDKKQDDADALLNASKRRQSIAEERTAKKRKIDHQPATQPPVSISQNMLKPAQPANAYTQPERLASPILSSDNRPPHLRDTSPAASSDSIPPHLRDSSPAADSDHSIPPHLRDSSPAVKSDHSIPPHLRDSSPAAQSDYSIPPHLRDSSPAASSDHSIPLHLRSSTPTPKPSSPQVTRPSTHSKIKHASVEDAVETSSPPPMAVDELIDDAGTTSKHAAPESEDDSEDGYREFQHLDFEHVPDRYTKKLLAELDEAERKRKKYRAVAVMTIYLSLQRRSDLEKLYGVQTNLEAKAKNS
ncbi:hypothetical protein ABW21_db0205356 [Orbilia brochopaga]|nr:hypothetical protein ABW21_db0205356 [Drechslerella brochopaga]